MMKLMEQLENEKANEIITSEPIKFLSTEKETEELDKYNWRIC